MAALYCGRDEKMNILSITKYAAQNWKGVTIEALFEAPPNILEKLSDRLVIDKENVLRVCV